ncbi:MAG: CHAT domain-containing protein, partial [Albidovulum sp.]
GLTAREGAIAALPALPETRCELAATADSFGPESQLLLQDHATETAIKSLSASGALERFRVLSFATHGLVAGELGANQAGLVLTPPDAATADDDGLLTIEEIAGLRINADFVLLSACNTAAGSRPVDDSLSGLASAFFLAGARSLLVSHWPVYSDAAVRLTTGMFGALSADPAISRPEALRRSMLAILDDPAADAAMLHPAFWGPFIIAGGG